MLSLTNSSSYLLLGYGLITVISSLIAAREHLITNILMLKKNSICTHLITYI